MGCDFNACMHGWAGALDPAKPSPMRAATPLHMHIAQPLAALRALPAGGAWLTTTHSKP